MRTADFKKVGEINRQNHREPRREPAGAVSDLRRLLATGTALAGVCLMTCSAIGQNWQRVGSLSGSYQPSVACSADGATVVVVAGPNSSAVIISTNYGASWTPSNPLTTNFWVSAACSANGSKIFLDSYDGPVLGPIAVSTNVGAAWTASGAPMENWSSTAGSIACSAGGNTVLAAKGIYGSADGGLLFVSTNGGAAWTQTSAPTQYWSGVACSADGIKMVATSGNAAFLGKTTAGGIFISTNAGATWTHTSAPTNNWTSVASSADGAKLVAAYGGLLPGSPYYATGAIYTSTDSGATWTPSSAPTMNWLQVVSSADGTKLAALTGVLEDRINSLWISTNSGAAWTAAWTVPFGAPPTAMAMSADGTSLVAASGSFVAANGSIYLLEGAAPAMSPPQILGITDLETVQLSFTVPTRALLTVVASGTLPLVYQWQFGGTNLPGATNANFVISSTAMTDAGDYQVIVTNAFGSVTSAIARIEVLPPLPMAPFVNSMSLRSEVPPGGEAFFLVSPVGTQPFFYQWMFNGANLPGQTNSSLTVPNVQVSGDYQVSVSNSLGGVIIDFPFTLQNAPLIVFLPTSPAIFPGGSATFSVGVIGAPPFSYQWSFSGTNITDATNSTFTIPDVQPADAGSYTVVVSNSFGSVNDSPYTLTIATNPPGPMLETPQLSAQPPGMFAFGWSALIGQKYKVQSKGDLSQTNWIDVGSEMTATNGFLSIIDPVGTNSQRFYRAVLLR